MIEAALIIGLLIVIIGIFAIPALKMKKDLYEKTGKHPKGHYMGIGIALGLPLGVPIGIALGNISIGIPMGMVFGVVLGSVMERQHKDELRPLTKEEIEYKNKAVIFIIALLLLGTLALFYFM